MTILACLIVTIAAMSAGDSPLLGPIWGGDASEDAGSSPKSAQTVSLISASGGATGLTKIVGATTAIGITAPDSVDMYEVQVQDPALFAVSTTEAAFNTMLFVFRRFELPDGSLVAIPIVANDNANQQTTNSSISQPAGGKIPGLTPGRYFIAVAPNGARAQGALPSGALTDLFEFQANDGTGLAFPFPNLVATPLVDWTLTTQEGGPYEISVGGGIVAERPAACEGAPILGIGTHPFGNPMPFPENAVKLGLENICGTPGYIFSPTWFRIGGCDGLVSISLCRTSTGSSPYGLVVFRGGCGNLQPVACAQAVIGEGGGDCAQVLNVSFESQGCSDVIVAFGPRVPPQGGVPIGGEGFLDIACTPGPQAADLNGDGVVNGVDLCVLLAQWTGSDDGHEQ